MPSKNQIVWEYINSNTPLLQILESHFNKTEFIETVLSELVKKISLKEIDAELMEAIDKAIIIGHPDQNLFLLFIDQAIGYYCRFNQLVKANTLCSIASSLMLKEIEPFIIATFTQSRAKLLRYEGKGNEYLKVMEESIKVVDKNCPRYCFLYHNYLFVYATLGRLKEDGEYKKNPFAWPTKDEEVLRTTELRLMNAIRTGDYEDGFKLIQEYKNIYGNKLPTDIEDYEDRLRIYSGDIEPDNYHQIYFKCMAKAYQYFSLGRFEDAMQELETYKIIDHRTHLFMYYSFYMKIHFELSQGFSGKAKLLMLEKEAKGDIRFIDDLFYGRIQLLEKDWKSASESFARLSQNIKRFGAIHLLIFELQFAKEMNLKLILKLINGDKLDFQKSAKKIQPETKSKSIVIETGVKLLIGESQANLAIKNLVKKYAPLKAPILVTGETGTGKELVSRAIHDEGLFPQHPFLAINCGALTDTLLQSELFGYEAGAFTGALKRREGVFAAAKKGTVFLDEFGDISPKLQVSLLRVLESGEIKMIGSNLPQKIECKIVIATNVDLHNAVIEKKFREDLYFRLSRFEIHLPALRDRKEDLPELIQHFLNNCSDHNPKKISVELQNALMDYHWPGNIRELKNEMERLFILKPDKNILERSDFDFKHLQKLPKNNNQKAIAELQITNQPPFDPFHEIIRNGFPIEQRHELLKSLFQKYKKLTRKQLIEITKFCPATISNDIKALTNSGVIVRRTPTKSPRSYYFELS